jgi:hypothetical protein
MKDSARGPEIEQGPLAFSQTGSTVARFYSTSAASAGILLLEAAV